MNLSYEIMTEETFPLLDSRNNFDMVFAFNDNVSYMWGMFKRLQESRSIKAT
jgi:hypothetical protein